VLRTAVGFRACGSNVDDDTGHISTGVSGVAETMTTLTCVFRVSAVAYTAALVRARGFRLCDDACGTGTVVSGVAEMSTTVTSVSRASAALRTVDLV